MHEEQLEEQRQLLEQCQDIFLQDYTPAYLANHSSKIQESVVKTMQHIDTALDVVETDADI